MTDNGLNIIAVRLEECSKIEKLFNMFRIGLNDWDVSRKFDLDGLPIAIYIVKCYDSSVIESIKNQIKNI